MSAAVPSPPARRARASFATIPSPSARGAGAGSGRGAVPTTRTALALALALALAPPVASAGAPVTPASLAGRYALQVKMHVDAKGLPQRDDSAGIDAIVRAGPAPDAVRVQLTWGRYACELAAQLRAGGDLLFEPGQGCPFDVAEPDARGHLDARLHSGRGRAGEAALDIDFAFDVSGALSTRVAAHTVKVLGTEVSLPATWTPQLPVRGTVAGSGSGRRMDPDAAGRGGRE